jgi:hypothetical protein
MLAQLVRKLLPGLVLNATFAEPGDVVFKHACALGCEGIVSKRLGLPECAAWRCSDGGWVPVALARSPIALRPSAMRSAIPSDAIA